ncbi:hypothetical protein JOB18_008875 [Solea senegalensis]|uniref:Uncharacterized protein n=1 Tax=Solea senegalensis TaxID=28829 RepID=A0AAV6QFK6_SOLSE|nr:hypothetical protein JOB18_008875 [Solea senegalensis]
MEDEVTDSLQALPQKVEQSQSRKLAEPQQYTSKCVCLQTSPLSLEEVNGRQWSHWSAAMGNELCGRLEPVKRAAKSQPRLAHVSCDGTHPPLTLPTSLLYDGIRASVIARCHGEKHGEARGLGNREAIDFPFGGEPDTRAAAASLIPVFRLSLPSIVCSLPPHSSTFIHSCSPYPSPPARLIEEEGGLYSKVSASNESNSLSCVTLA